MTRLALAAALLCAPLSAQITHSAQTSSDWEATVLESGLGTIVAQDTLPAGTPLTAMNGALLADSVSTCAGGPSTAGAGADSMLTLGTNSISLRATASSSTNAACSVQREAFFEGSFDWTINAATPTAGELRLTIRNPHINNAYTSEVNVEDLSTGLRIDLPDSGTPNLAEILFDLGDRWVVSTPFDIDSSRTVRVHVSARVPTGALSSTSTQIMRGQIDLEFVPAPSGTVAIDGSSCNASSNGFLATLQTAAGTPLQRRIGLTGFGHPPTTFGQFFIFGTVDPMLPIPPTNCLLRTDILAPILIPGFSPNANLEIPVALPVSGLLRTQFLAGEMAGPTALWSTSEAVVLSL